MERCTSRPVNTHMRWTHPPVIYDGAFDASCKIPAVWCGAWRLRETGSIGDSAMVMSSLTILAVVIRCGRPDSQKPMEGLRRSLLHRLRGTGWCSSALPEPSGLVVASLQDWMEKRDASCGGSRWLRPATLQALRRGRRESVLAADRSGPPLV